MICKTNRQYAALFEDVKIMFKTIKPNLISPWKLDSLYNESGCTVF